MFLSIEAGADLNAVSHLLVATAICDILVTGVNVPRSLVDATEALSVCKRHALVVLGKSRASKIPALDPIEPEKEHIFAVPGAIEPLTNPPAHEADDDDDLNFMDELLCDWYDHQAVPSRGEDENEGEFSSIATAQELELRLRSSDLTRSITAAILSAGEAD